MSGNNRSGPPRNGLANNIDVWFRQGVDFHRAGKIEQAEQLYLRVLKFQPRHSNSLCNLGVIRKNKGAYLESLVCYRKAVEAEPKNADALSNMGLLLGKMGKHSEAVQSLRQAVELKPNFGDAWLNLAYSAFVIGGLVEAETAARRALLLLPKSAGAMNNLGNALYPQLGKLDEAIDCFRAALALEPANKVASSNLLFCLNNHPELSIQEITSNYADWARKNEPSLVDRWSDFPYLSLSDRKIRVGYISPDFRGHSMRYFLAPLIERHNHKKFDFILYADNIESDSWTEKYKSAADVWRPIRHLSDSAVWSQVRADAIDVLVDLAGHTADNRLAVFAKRAAPIQVSYLGYGFTTGLKNMDYFIADGEFVPAGAESAFSERLFRLNRAQYVYRADTELEVSSLPAKRNGYTTFGCFSRTIRLNHRVVRCWAQILLGTPGSRLLLNTRFLREDGVKDLMIDAFKSHGVEPDRIEVVYESPPWRSYTEMVDIALDPFPHNGGTTTFDALWMGCPVVSLRSHPGIGCFGASILAPLGMSDWLAMSEEQYIAIAIGKASKVDELEILRLSLRERMRKSELCDEQGLAATIEAAYKVMWDDWAQSGRQKIQGVSA